MNPLQFGAVLHLGLDDTPLTRDQANLRDIMTRRNNPVLSYRQLVALAEREGTAEYPHDRYWFVGGNFANSATLIDKVSELLKAGLMPYVVFGAVNCPGLQEARCYFDEQAIPRGGLGDVIEALGAKTFIPYRWARPKLATSMVMLIPGKYPWDQPQVLVIRRPKTDRVPGICVPGGFHGAQTGTLLDTAINECGQESGVWVLAAQRPRVILVSEFSDPERDTIDTPDIGYAWYVPRCLVAQAMAQLQADGVESEKSFFMPVDEFLDSNELAFPHNKHAVREALKRSPHWCLWPR